MLGPRQKVFDESLEKKLLDYLLNMESRLFGLTSRDVRSIAFQLAERNNLVHTFDVESGLAGREWLRGFLRRNPTITLRCPEPTSAARARAFNAHNVGKFFDLLESMTDQHHFPPHRIYNVDETGITTVQTKPSRIMARKGKKQVGSLSSAERGVLTTAVICMSAGGVYVPPMLIFPRVRLNPALTEGAPPGTTFQCDKSGWMQTEIFTRWMEHFIQFVKPSAEEPVLLVLDGHHTHAKNIACIEVAVKNNVHMLVLPPHCSHRMQPLDVTFMKPLNSFYSRSIEKFLRNNPGKVVSLYQIARLFGEAYLQAALPATAISGFLKTGICPVNRDVFSESDFIAAETTDIVESPVEEIQQQSSTENRPASASVDLDETFEGEENCPPADEPCTSRTATVGPEDILPVPKMKEKSTCRRSTKRGSTAIITSPEYRAALRESKNLSQRDQAPKKMKIRVKAPKTPSDSDTFCLYCGDTYLHSNAGEKWVQCITCKDWAHAECCADPNDKNYTCEYCC